MNIKIIALGKLKEKFLKEGIEEFSKRLSPYCSFGLLNLIDRDKGCKFDG